MNTSVFLASILLGIPPRETDQSAVTSSLCRWIALISLIVLVLIWTLAGESPPPVSTTTTQVVEP